MTAAWRWALVAPAVIGLVATAVPLLLYWPQLPDPIAVHWGIDLRPDGSLPKRTALLPPAALIGGMLLVALIGSTRAYVVGRAVRVWLVTFVCALAATVSAMIVSRNLGSSVWTEAESMTPGLLALQVGLPLVLATALGLSALLVWREVKPPAPARTPPLPLAAGARAYWTGSASNGWLLALGGVLLVLAAALQAALPQPRLLAMLQPALVAAAVALEFVSRIRVTVDQRGVRVRYGHLGLWTRRIPLARIVAVQAVELDPLAHSGWGYRGSLLLFGRASIVVRSGPALKLDLARGQRLFVTVDDAATGARLLSALLEREPAAHAAAEATSSGS
jgi:hypothetical protein